MHVRLPYRDDDAPDLIQEVALAPDLAAAIGAVRAAEAARREADHQIKLAKLLKKGAKAMSARRAAFDLATRRCLEAAAALADAQART